MKQSASSRVFFSLFLLILFLTFNSCGPNESYSKDTVRVWALDNPKAINPLLESDATGSYIAAYIIQSLLGLDYDTYELIPMLAKSRPELEMIQDSSGKDIGMKFTYEIREEAIWDDGSPVTADDVETTYKLIMAPRVSTDHLKPYLNLVTDFIKYPDNPKKFTVVTDRVDARAEANTGYEPDIIQKKIYDPKGILDKYTLLQLRDEETLADNEDLINYANEVNSAEYLRENTKVAGSGPYRLVSWRTGQDISLEKKENWWGEQVANGNEYFENFPERIEYVIYNNMAAAITALKGQKLDVMHSIRPEDYVKDLMQNDNAKENFNLAEPPFWGYSYFGINIARPKFRNKLTRQAFAYLVDYDRLMKDVVFGQADRVVGPVHPLDEENYNADLDLYTYDLEKAKSLLAQAGWKDSDGNGVLDQVIDGEKTELNVQFLTNSGNKTRENIILIFADAAKKAGVNVEIVSVDWSIMSDRLEVHDFDMYYGGWIGEPIPENYAQIFGTESANGGSNYTNFGDASTDALIEKINTTVDEQERAKYIKEFQAILHDNGHYIFLWTPFNNLAINKKFTNTRVSGFKPGYWVPGFKSSGKVATNEGA